MNGPLVDDSTVSAMKQGVRDDKIVSMVRSLYSNGESWKKEYAQNWDELYRFYIGKHWPEKRPSYRTSAVVPICWSTIQTVVPIMTDAEPTFDITPSEPADAAFSDVVSDLVKSWWSRSSMELVVTQWVYDSCIYDAGILKVTWNEDANEGSGDVLVTVIDPCDIRIPKGSQDFNHPSCGWVIHEMVKPIGEMKRKFPDKADLITATKVGRGEESNAPKDGSIVMTSPIDRKAPIDLVKSSSDGGDGEVVRVLECWLEDYSTIEEERDGKKIRRRNYPNGRIVQILPDTGVLLDDKPNPRRDGKVPFVRLVNTVEPRKFWGHGEVEQLVHVNKLVDKILSNMMDYMNMTGNPLWIIDHTSGVNPNQITNQIGLVLMKAPGSEVRRDIPPAMPSYYINLYTTLVNLANTTSGVHDVTQGRKPTGVTAAEAISTLQDAAQTRIRLKERNLRVSLAQLGRLVVSTMMQWYREPRVVKMTGKNPWPDYFEFYLEDDQGNPDRVIPKVNKYDYEESSNKYTGSGYEALESSKGVFDIRVQAGTAMPFMREKKSALAKELFQLGVIDEEDLLTALEYPDKEKVLRKVQDRKKMEGAENARVS